MLLGRLAATVRVRRNPATLNLTLPSDYQSPFRFISGYGLAELGAHLITFLLSRTARFAAEQPSVSVVSQWQEQQRRVYSIIDASDPERQAFPRELGEGWTL